MRSPWLLLAIGACLCALTTHGAGLNVTTNGGVVTPTNFPRLLIGAGSNVVVTPTNTGSGWAIHLDVPAAGTGGGGGSGSGATNYALNNWTNYGQVSWRSNAVVEGEGGAYGGYVATNVVSFTNGPIQWLTMTNNVLWLWTTNRDAGEQRNVELWISPTHHWIATNRVVILNSGWRRFSGAQTNALGSNKLGIVRLRLLANGGESAVGASWEPEL